MWPEITRIGRVPINSYGLMIVVGFLLGMYIGRRETLRRGLPDRFPDLAMAVLLCGIIGGRIFYYVEFYESNFTGKSFLEIFKIWEGGLVFYGAGIGSFIGGLAFLRWKRLPVAPFLDVCSLVAPIGMGFGRVGCFLNGCCFGRLCAAEYPLGVVFPESSAAALEHERLNLITRGQEALLVHPVQLYQGVHDLFLFFLMWLFFRKVSPPAGAGMPMLFVMYGIGRFFLEGFRADNRLTWTGLTISQNISVALVALCASLLFWLLWRGRHVGPGRI